MKKIDNIDILGVASLELSPDEREKEYFEYYNNLAKRNLNFVKSGQVKDQYGISKEDNSPWDVWHICTVLDTFPALRDEVDRLFGKEKKFNTGVDVGCGTVTFFDFIDIDESVLIDLSPEYCKFMKDKGWDARCEPAENMSIEDGWADLVVCSDILEHVLSLEDVLCEVDRILSNEGVLLVNVPWDQDLEKIPKNGFPHLRTFNDKNIEKRFKNFKIVSKKVILEKKRNNGKISIGTANIILKKSNA